MWFRILDILDSICWDTITALLTSSSCGLAPSSLQVLMFKWKTAASAVLCEPKRLKCQHSALSRIHKHLSPAPLVSSTNLACPLTQPGSTIEILLCLCKSLLMRPRGLIAPLFSHVRIKPSKERAAERSQFSQKTTRLRARMHRAKDLYCVSHIVFCGLYVRPNKAC